MMKYSEKHSVTETCIRYRVSRTVFYKWKGRYDGSLESLEDLSHRPHNSPKGHTDAEKRLVLKALKRFGRDLLLAFQWLTEKKRYKRTYGGFKRFAVKIREEKAARKKAKKKPKLYEGGTFPGQKVQVDVKFVPSECVTGNAKYYQYTAVDEFSRWTFREMYDEHSTYSSADFLEKLIKAAPFKIKKIQTDNGTEFTNTLLVTKSTHKTLFEDGLAKHGIEYQRIRIATPRHNGRVERRHRTDSERFYATLKMANLADGRRQLAEYQAKSNGYIMTCLGLKSPNAVLREFRLKSSN
jgi:IS30 family transposase